LSRNTVAKWLHGEVDGPPKYRRGEQPNKLSDFHDRLKQASYGGQVLWAEITYVLYGKQRHLMTDYIHKAKAGDWAGAKASWAALRPVANFWDDLVTWEGVYKTKTYAASFAIVKPWYEAIGLKAGPNLPTVHSTPPGRVEWLRERLTDLGVC
jgi:4-hydroxy-tetrahydrodipicolinate synthase